MKKRVALVLSGGGALGYAHIGVIKQLEENKIPIDMIVGTSMGGLVGAAYASGLTTDQMIDLGSKFKTLNFIDINFNKSGLFSGKGIMSKVSKFIPDENIENLKIPFACVGCDLNNEKEIIYNKGSVLDAVRATISIPGLIVPVKEGHDNIVDGGIINNLPEDVAKDMGADVIISVDVIQNYKIKGTSINVFESLFHSINLLTKENLKRKKRCYDVLIAPNLTGLHQMEFSQKTLENCVRIGESETKKYIKEIKRLLK